MKERANVGLFRLLWPFGLSSLLLLVLLSGLSRAMGVDSEAALMIAAQEGGCTGLLDCGEAVSVCKQVRYLVPDLDFEQITGDLGRPVDSIVEEPVPLRTYTDATLRLHPCRVRLQPLNTDAQGEPGEWTEYEMVLTNDSNCRGDAYVGATSSRSWSVVIKPPEQPYPLAAHQSMIVTASVSVPAQTQAGIIANTFVTATLECESPYTDSGIDTAVITTSVCCVPVEQVNIDGPASGFVNIPYSFTAAVSPPSATPPINYTWSPSPTWGQSTEQVIYTWDATGIKTIIVTTTNACGVATDAHSSSISISERRVYLPLIFCGWPPLPPELYIDNADIYGNYDVCWRADGCADSYVLEESTQEGFPPPPVTPPFSCTAGDSCCYHYDLDGTEPAWHYYRVKVCDGWGCTGWSDVLDVWWEHENNDSAITSNDSLLPGKDHRGYPDDEEDWFKFYMPVAGGRITLTLDNHVGRGVDLLLYNGEQESKCGKNEVTHDASEPYVITREAVVNWWYCICIKTDSGYTTATAYTLRPMFP